jgi:hypothetical protein
MCVDPQFFTWEGLKILSFTKVPETRFILIRMLSIPPRSESRTFPASVTLTTTVTTWPYLRLCTDLLPVLQMHLADSSKESPTYNPQMIDWWYKHESIKKSNSKISCNYNTSTVNNLSRILSRCNMGILPVYTSVFMWFNSVVCYSNDILKNIALHNTYTSIPDF